MMRATRKELGQEKKSKLEGEQEDERGVKKKKKSKKDKVSTAATEPQRYTTESPVPDDLQNFNFSRFRQ